MKAFTFQTFILYSFIKFTYIQVEFASVSDRESKRRALSGLRSELSSRQRSLNRVAEWQKKSSEGEGGEEDISPDAQLRMEELAKEFEELRTDVANRYIRD